MASEFKEYFTFNRRDRKGVFWLLLILLGVGILRFVEHQNRFKTILTQLEARQEKTNRKVALPSRSKTEHTVDSALIGDKSLSEIQYFNFNPNTLSVLGWGKLGFSEKQVNTIINFRNAGAVFHVKEDVLKLYCIDRKKYDELYEWINLPDTRLSEKKIMVSKEPAKELAVAEQKVELNINLADTTELKLLRGIGSYYARKIVEYRIQLGGYSDYEQLMEIWKMRRETVEMLKVNTILKGEIRPILINVVTSDSLAGHPYFSKRKAKGLIAFRKAHGDFKSWEDVGRCLLVDSLDKLKWMPYIAFDARE